MSKADRPERLDLLSTTLGLRKRRVLYSMEGRREAAVLVPIVRHMDRLDVVFTLRTNHLPTHKGQVAFPGGGVDPEDVDAVDTALREAEEEIGLPRADVDVLGLGDDVFSITGQKVTPVVGFINGMPDFRPSEHEIADIFTVPLAALRDPAAFYETELEGPSGATKRVPFFKGGKHQIWGLTAWVLKELLDVMDGDGGRLGAA